MYREQGILFSVLPYFYQENMPEARPPWYREVLLVYFLVCFFLNSLTFFVFCGLLIARWRRPRTFFMIKVQGFRKKYTKSIPKLHGPRADPQFSNWAIYIYIYIYSIDLYVYYPPHSPHTQCRGGKQRFSYENNCFLMKIMLFLSQPSFS